MRFNLRNWTSFVLCAAIAASTFPAFAVMPDEGMYTPDQIAKLPLKQKGIKLKPLDIYNPNGVDISDAVISLSIGCTAEFVSPKGLILTNHHCGFDALVAASTPEKDFANLGYRAGSMAEELPAKDYSLTITNRIEDVTAKVAAGTESLKGDELAKALAANADKLQKEEQAKAAPGVKIAISPLNSGFFYYLYETQNVNDIRVVYAPPQMIGFYGGDPDNFEWSRHTGDFTFLRAYVGKDGKPAPYSKDNIPYTPKKFLTISLDGLKENDPVFVMGFPGGTTRYRESQFIRYAGDVNFPFLAAYLRAWSESLKEVGKRDEAKRVELQAEIANLDNSRKLYEGGVVGLRRSKIYDQRVAQEQKFAAWVASSPERKAKYGSVLSDIDALSRDFYATAAHDRLLRTIPNPGLPMTYRFLLDAYAAAKAGRKLDEKQAAGITEALGAREPEVDQALTSFLVRSTLDLPEGQKFGPSEKFFGGLKGKQRSDAVDAFVRDITANNDFSTPAKMLALYSAPVSEWQSRYPKLTEFLAAHADARAAYAQKAAKYNASIDALRVQYQRGMAEMSQKLVYPDANFTMRFTYGNVKGYQPREAVLYTPFTTLDGVLEKNTGVFPFDVPSKLKDLAKSKDFGRYGVNGSMPVNFLASTDIIGGNSGSPIMNANGEQVGIIFDGNFEGLGNDIVFDSNTNRSIAVDIRYVLFVTDKFADAKWIVDEMVLKGGAKAKAAGAR